MTGQTSKGLKIALLVYAIWWAIYGVAHVTSPEALQAIDPWIERVLGMAIIALALGALLAYLQKTWEKARDAVLVQIVWMLLYALTMAWGILSGGITPLAWTPTIIAAGFAMWLGLLSLRQESKQK